ncbi:MAG: hypothetical protein JXL84_26615 [Deltaproteobacteria bacterium]|nr:hypothetical protein [Deltaproteobacteria bacterium]
MGTAAKKIDPEEYILAVLPPKERLDAALKIAGEAFKNKFLTIRDIESAVRSVRRKAYAKKK